MESNNKFGGLQSLRALAALLVVFQHVTYFSTGARGLDPLAYLPIDFGRIGVCLFFVISGFVMAFCLPQGRRFFLNRVRRIYPAYWLAIGVSYLLLSGWYGWHFTWPSFFLIPREINNSYQIPYWTLCYEMAFYLLLSGVALISASARAITVGCAVWIAAIVAAQFGPKFSPFAAGDLILLSTLNLNFIAGLLLGVHWNALVKRIASWKVTAALLIAAPALLLFQSHWSVGYSAISACCYAAVVVLAVRHLRVRWLEKFGDLSFGVYLLHFPIITLTIHLLQVNHPGMRLSEIWLITMAECLLGSALFGWIEVKFHAWLKAPRAVSSATVASDGRVHGLDGLRGWAALSVVLGHCATAYGGIPIYLSTVKDLASFEPWQMFFRLWHTVFNADAAVMVFFVLSGYVLCASLQKRHKGAMAAFIPYVVRRLARLYPVAIVSGLLVFLALPAVTWEHALGAMFLYDRTANGVLWSLQVELIGSVVIFALWAIGSRKLVYAALAAFAYLYLAVPSWIYPYAFGKIESAFVMFPAAFVCGYALANGDLKIPQSRALLFLAVLAYLTADLFFGRAWTTRLIEITSATIIVGIIAKSPVKFLDNRFSQFLGTISYPMYLTQVITMYFGEVAIRYAMPDAPAVAKLLTLGTVGLVPVFALSWALVVSVERPGMKLPSRFRTKTREAAPARSALG